MNKFLPIALLLVILQLAQAAVLVKGIPIHNVPSKDRKAFLRWSRNEQFTRYQDRERFREELMRTMHNLMQNHNTKTQLANIESEAVRDLEKRFARTKNRIDRMKDHTVAGINDLIALT